MGGNQNKRVVCGGRGELLATDTRSADAALNVRWVLMICGCCTQTVQRAREEKWDDCANVEKVGSDEWNNSKQSRSGQGLRWRSVLGFPRTFHQVTPPARARRPSLAQRHPDRKRERLHQVGLCQRQYHPFQPIENLEGCQIDSALS